MTGLASGEFLPSELLSGQDLGGAALEADPDVGQAVESTELVIELGVGAVDQAVVESAEFVIGQGDRAVWLADSSAGRIVDTDRAIGGSARRILQSICPRAD
jgi:hypothetical protein